MPEKNAGRIMPMVAVASVEDVRDFYVKKLGFEQQMGVIGKDGKLDFVSVVSGTASMMFSRAADAQPRAARQAVEFYVTVEDVDALFRTIEKRGVAVAEPLTDQWWGDRTFVVSDPSGYRVWFSEKKSDAVPPPGTKIV